MGDHRAILVEVRAACEAYKAYNDQFLAPQPLPENATPSSHGVHFDAAEDAKLRERIKQLGAQYDREWAEAGTPDARWNWQSYL